MGMFEIFISKLEFPLKYEVKHEDQWGIYLQRFEKKFETEIAIPYNKILKLFTDTYPGKL